VTELAAAGVTAGTLSAEATAGVTAVISEPGGCQPGGGTKALLGSCERTAPAGAEATTTAGDATAAATGSACCGDAADCGPDPGATTGADADPDAGSGAGTGTGDGTGPGDATAGAGVTGWTPSGLPRSAA
jgi:hypothetical protein